MVDCVPADAAANTRYVSLFGEENSVSHCYFAGKRNLGSTLVVWLNGQPNYHRIERNWFGPRPPLGQNGGETIRIGDSRTSVQNSRTVVEGNLFDRCDGEIETISNKSCENLYRGNAFVDCLGTLTLRHGNRCRVEGNWFFGKGKRDTGGVRIIGEDHVVVNNYFERVAGRDGRAALSMMSGIVDSPLNGYFQVQRAIVAFNTFIHCAQPFAIGVSGAGTTLPPVACVAANNICFGRGPAVAVIHPESHVTWAANVYDGMTGSEPHMEAHLRWVRKDEMLRPESPEALRGGHGEFEYIEEDIDGQACRGAKDIGCDEIVDDDPIRRIPSPFTTAPEWWRIE